MAKRGGLVFAVAAGVYLAGHLGHPATGTSVNAAAAAAPPAVTAVSAAGSYTPLSYADAVLRDGGWRTTRCNEAALVGWQHAEGDWTHGHAGWRNPLNDTYAGPGGSWLGNGNVAATVNSVGVRAYRTWAVSLTAVEFSLRGPDYGRIRAALTAGDNAQAVANAVGSSLWGTGNYSATC